MDEAELKRLPINDEFGQCMQKLRIMSPDIIVKRKNEIRTCHHLFVKLSHGEEIYGYNSTDYYREPNEVECVHCGLTNRFNKIESILASEYLEHSKSFKGIILSLTGYNRNTLESEMFDEIFKQSYFRSRKSFNNLDINLIREECLSTYHPGLLYRLALQINPRGNNQELFDIMQTLHLLETVQEKIRLQTEQQSTSLLDRYYNSNSRNLVVKSKKIIRP